MRITGAHEERPRLDFPKRRINSLTRLARRTHHDGARPQQRAILAAIPFQRERPNRTTRPTTTIGGRVQAAVFKISGGVFPSRE